MPTAEEMVAALKQEKADLEAKVAAFAKTEKAYTDLQANYKAIGATLSTLRQVSPETHQWLATVQRTGQIPPFPTAKTADRGPDPEADLTDPALRRLQTQFEALQAKLDQFTQAVSAKEEERTLLSESQRAWAETEKALGKETVEKYRDAGLKLFGNLPADKVVNPDWAKGIILSARAQSGDIEKDTQAKLLKEIQARRTLQHHLDIPSGETGTRRAPADFSQAADPDQLQQMIAGDLFAKLTT